MRPLRLAWRHKGLMVLALVAAACFLGPLLLSRDGNSIDLTRRLQPPAWGAPLGTDENGRDMLARLLEGGRVSLFVGFGAGALAGAIGCAIGLAAGTLGRTADTVLMRFTDLALSFPPVLVILLFASLLAPGPGQLLLLIALMLWMPGARIVRARTLELREAPYVEAAHAVGVPRWRLLLLHIAPNMQETLAVNVVLAVNHAMLNEAVVSFLGLGIRPPDASWGTLLTNAQSYFFRGWWLLISPGLAIMVTLLALSSAASRLTARGIAARPPARQ